MASPLYIAIKPVADEAIDKFQIAPQMTLTNDLHGI